VAADTDISFGKWKEQLMAIKTEIIKIVEDVYGNMDIITKTLINLYKDYTKTQLEHIKFGFVDSETSMYGVIYISEKEVTGWELAKMMGLRHTREPDDEVDWDWF
jgi:hypothetical protein